jgi:hypothetical protein
MRIASAFTALGFLFGLALRPILAQSDIGALEVEIRDQASGQIVPAMICITSLVDNSWRIPSDWRMPAGYVTNRDIIDGRVMGIDYVMGTQKKWSPPLVCGPAGCSILEGPCGVFYFQAICR